MDPTYPYPGKPRQRALKFSAVRGVVSSKSSKRIRPAGRPKKNNERKMISTKVFYFFLHAVYVCLLFLFLFTFFSTQSHSPAGLLSIATSIAKIGLCWTSLKDGRKDRTGAKACLAAASGWPVLEKKLDKIINK